MVDRTPFSQIEEQPSLVIRRLTSEELVKYEQRYSANLVGIFTPAKLAPPRKEQLIAVVEFDDLFDIQGNRFYDN